MQTAPSLTADRARDLLSYDPATGALRWKSSRPGVRAGTVAGRRAAHGYRVVMIDGKQYYEHRVAVLLVRGRWPVAQVDHANGLRDDNRWSNLREATAALNAVNRQGGPVGRFGRGVRRRGRRFQARIGVGGRSVYLGTFDSADDAHAMYVAAVRHFHGQYAPAACAG